MGRRGLELFFFNPTFLDPDHRELLAMAEMIAQPALRQRDGHFKGVLVRHGYLRCQDFCRCFCDIFFFGWFQTTFYFIHELPQGLDKGAVVRRFQERLASVGRLHYPEIEGQAGQQGHRRQAPRSSGRRPG